MINDMTKRNFDHLITIIDNEFERSKKLFGSKLRCSKGCSQCCSQIFNITLLDSIIIGNYLRSLDRHTLSILKLKSEDYISKSENPENSDADFHIKPKISCPALNENGECSIYEARPVICRRFGPPVYDYKDPGKIYACELNFSEGEEIFDDELIPNQTEIGKKWDELKTEFNIENGFKKTASTTIAEAILNF